MTIFLLVLGIILFISLVVVHELGHFIAARRHGIEVEEFGIGLPPRAYVKKLKNGALFSLNWLPLGGFVKLKGEHDADRAKGSYGAASLGAKTEVMLAGVAMNLLAAFVLLTILAWVGMPTIINNQFAVASDTKIVRDVSNKGEVRVDEVAKSSAAERAGIKAGDILLSVGGQEIHQPDAVRGVAEKYANQDTELTFRRNGQVVSSSVKIGDNSSNTGYLGIAISSNESGFQSRRFTWSAPVVAIGFMKQVTVLTIKGLGAALKGLGSTIAGLVTANKQARQAGQTAATAQVSGPVGIYKILKDGSQLGIQFVLIIVAIVSLTLAIMNVLPIPALDGGRLFVTWLYRLLRKPLTEHKEDLIHGTGFAVLMVLVILITIVDFRR